MTSGRSWDAVVVGGGLLGCSAAYHLARAGVRTLLIEQGDLACGASGANFGLVQVQDAEPGLSLALTIQGYARFATLEAELDYDCEYRRAGYLLLIETERQWAALARRATQLQAAGLAVELFDRGQVSGLEPHLAAGSMIGGLYHPNEGKLNPFKLVYAYARRGRTYGLEVWTQTEARKVRIAGGRVAGVDTGRGPVTAGWVILAAGAWTRGLGAAAGVDIPVRWLHGEALITEPLAPIARHAMASAAFFEDTEDAEHQIVGFCLHQRPEGNVMLGEAARVTGKLGRRVTATALPAIAREARRRFPILGRAGVLRSWAIPVAFVDDNQPLLGPVDGVEGLLVATGLKSTIVLTPIVGELVAAMVTGSEIDPAMAAFSPSRGELSF